MKHIEFYLDFISPYAYLAFEKLPEALKGISYRVTHKPVLFAALLKHHGQLGPAEIASKRDWTYRQVAWQAHVHGVALQLPASHPFNPLLALRVASLCARPSGVPTLPPPAMTTRITFSLRVDPVTAPARRRGSRRGPARGRAR